MLHLFIALAGLLVLLKAADVFIDQSLAIAKKIKISGFLIGFTIISIGTALPDLTISTFAVIDGDSSFAISTFIGSAMVNITLLIGALSFFTKYRLYKADIKKNIPITFLAGVLLVALILLFKFQFSWIAGVISVSAFLAIIFFVKENNPPIIIKEDREFHSFLFLLSFVMLILAGKFSTENFLTFAQQYHIADTTIGYFIVGIGITAPELITSLEVIKKGNLQLSLGNILGATLINILLIPGLGSFFNTLDFTGFLPSVLCLLLGIFVFMILAISGKKYYITRKEGVVMLLIYLLFILIQVF